MDELQAIESKFGELFCSYCRRQVQFEIDQLVPFKFFFTHQYAQRIDYSYWTLFVWLVWTDLEISIAWIWENCEVASNFKLIETNIVDGDQL